MKEYKFEKGTVKVYGVANHELVKKAGMEFLRKVEMSKRDEPVSTSK